MINQGVSVNRDRNFSKLHYWVLNKFEGEGIRYYRHKFLDGQHEAFLDYELQMNESKIDKHSYRKNIHVNDKTLVLRTFVVLHNIGWVLFNNKVS
mgnify:CR=1 FL=1